MFHHFIVVAFLVSLTQAAPQTFGLSMLDGRIVGGKPTTIEEHPYQVSLQYYSTHMCGAVVISENYVVTAAHCTAAVFSVTYLTVRAGSSFINRDGVIIQVATIYQNPNYNSQKTDYDISVLRLASPLSFGATIARVALPEFNETIVVGAISQISGWGNTVEGGNAPWQLQVVEMPIIDLEICKVAYGAENVTDRMMCAGLLEGGKDACQGDSGGPLIVNDTLIGIVSWGRGCARPNYPGVYASVPALRDYITEITGF